MLFKEHLNISKNKQAKLEAQQILSLSMIINRKGKRGNRVKDKR